MNSKKRVLLGLVISIFMIVFLMNIMSVNAGWWERLTGKASTTQVSLKVEGPPAVPEIVYITDIDGAMDAASVPPASRDLIGGATAPKVFYFYVYSDGGVGALPGDGAGDLITDINALITLKFKNPPNTERKSSDGGQARTCTKLRDDVSPAGAPREGQPVRIYSCTVAMQYYDDYGSSINQNWELHAMIKDDFNQQDTDLIPTPGPVRTTYFNILRHSTLIPEGGTMNFGTVNYGTNLNRQPADLSGTYPLQVKNTGNTDVTKTEVTGFNIPGVIDNTKLVNANWFSMAASSPCTGTGVEHNTLRDTGIPVIVHGASAVSDLRFCLRQILTTATQQDYSTTAVGGQPWNILITIP